MVVDIDKYSINKKFVQRWFLENNEEMGLAISIMANSTMCPAIVCAFWISEAAGWTKEGKDKIDSLKKFYGYDKILGIPKECPYEVL